MASTTGAPNTFLFAVKVATGGLHREKKNRRTVDLWLSSLARPATTGVRPVGTAKLLLCHEQIWSQITFAHETEWAQAIRGVLASFKATLPACFTR
jgi:hypothetical protein